MVNDDWGFRTQLFLSPSQMRQYITPWVKRFVATAHAKGKPALLHSCGQMGPLWPDIIDDMCFDGRHSYEDTILPVEDAYEQYGSRIAILGGMDMDFLCRSTPEDVYRRCKAMLERTQSRGGYALGTGNSLPDYIPAESYAALLRAARE
jgi:uroporphyrinogen decarboxylase